MKLFINIDLGEEWKDVDFIDVSPIYQISSHGRVRNKVTEKILKPYLCDNGKGDLRYRIGLSTGVMKNKSACIYKQVFVHRLVLMAFNPIDTPEKFVPNHLNFNMLDNRLTNLEWCTQKENIQYSLDRGRMKLGEDKPNTKLSNEKVHELCNLLERNLPKRKTYADILIIANMEPTKKNIEVLNKIKLRKNWKSISINYTWDETKNYLR